MEFIEPTPDEQERFDQARERREAAKRDEKKR